MTNAHSHEPRVRVNRPVDPSTIRAVGFDLDHTLAVYDDDRVNALAAEETLAYLVDDHGYPEALRDIHYDGRRTARGLQLDLTRATTTKLDSDRRVLRARHAGEWVDGGNTTYGNDALGWPNAHPIHSPFDLPTALLYDEISRVLTEAGRDLDGVQLCRDIRRELNRAHTEGQLKHRIMEDIGAFVHPLPGFAEQLHALRDAGTRLFLLTNSDLDYALALLDYLFPGTSAPEWPTLFELTFVHAQKPGFFESKAPPAPIPHGRGGSGTVSRAGGAVVLEDVFRARPAEMLYVGDHAAFDIAPAADRGWRTVHVVPDMVAVEGDSLWGHALEESGRPTWFGALGRDSADASVAGVGDVFGPPGHLALGTEAPGHG
jgi:HAD superfamily 5'-nucleotidase-like hydrolase